MQISNLFGKKENNQELASNKPDFPESLDDLIPQQPIKGRDEGYKLVDINLIDEPEQAMRSAIEEGELNELVISIKQVGLLEPIILKPKEERFEVIAGHRRFLACRIAKLPQVPSIIKRLGAEETEIVKMHENLYRQDISPLDEAKHFNYLIQKQKLTPARIAQFIGKSLTYVSERLATLDYPDELREALASKKITFSAAREFARHPDKSKILTFLRYAIQNGVTPNMARQWVQEDIRAQEGTNIVQSTGSDGLPPIEEQTSIYKCFYDGDPVEAANLTVVYMHDKCAHELQRAISDTAPEQEPASAAQA